MRFLFAWQHVEPSSRLSGLDGLRTIVATLDGFELAATAWERAVLPARMDRYDPAMLDMLCLTGEVGWARLSPPRPEQGAGASRPHGSSARRRSRCFFASTPISGRGCGRATPAIAAIRSVRMRARCSKRFAPAARRFFASWAC